MSPKDTTIIGTEMRATLTETTMTFMKDLGSVNPFTGEPLTKGYTGFSEFEFLIDMSDIEYELQEDGAIEFHIPTKKITGKILSAQSKLSGEL